MTTNIPDVLLCTNLDTGMPGQEPGKCVECRTDVTISKTGMETLRRFPGLKVVCMECGLNMAALDDDPRFIAASKSARAEVDAYRATQGKPPQTDAEWEQKRRTLFGMVNERRKLLK